MLELVVGVVLFCDNRAQFVLNISQQLDKPGQALLKQLMMSVMSRAAGSTAEEAEVEDGD